MCSQIRSVMLPGSQQLQPWVVSLSIILASRGNVPFLYLKRHSGRNIERNIGDMSSSLPAAGSLDSTNCGFLLDGTLSVNVKE